MSLGPSDDAATTELSLRAVAGTTLPAQSRTQGASARKPSRRTRSGVKGLFAAVAALGLAGVYLVPAAAAMAEAAPPMQNITAFSLAQDGAQTISTGGDVPVIEFSRSSYEVYLKPKPKPVEPVSAPVGASGAARVKYTGGGSKDEWLAASGIAQSDWGYVDYIVSRESGWNPNATNKSSGACGLVQALPCSKVPGNGYDPVDNLRWANGYAVGRYGSWAAAYDFWTRKHWW